VLDRPWGQTLSALASRGLTGEVTVICDGKSYVIGFDQGIVVAASSPLQSDAAVRVALTGHLVSSTQVADIVRKQVAAPHREEIEVLSEAARLAPDQAMRLRRRVIAQRAARTFSLERGDFLVDDTITLPAVAGSELDVRTVVYLGAKQFLSEGRLNAELGQLGGWFQIKPEAVEDLTQFGFGDGERAVVEPLIQGGGLADLERPELDPRMVRAVIYALVCSNMCLTEPNARAAQPKARPTPTPPGPRAREVDTPTLRRAEVSDPTTERRTAVDRAPTAVDPPRGTERPRRDRTPSAAPPPPSSAVDAPTAVGRVDRAPPPPPPSSGIDAPTAVGRKKSPSQSPTARNPNTGDAKTLAVEDLIKTKLAVLDQQPDHYALMGVARDATAAQIRGAYFALARQLHPDRLTSLGIVDDQRRAQRLFAELNTAFAILSDPKHRADYTAVLARGGSAAIKAEAAKAEELTQKVIDSEEAFRKGEMALRRDQIEVAIRELERAVQLNPEEADYHATLAWARFCGAPDKMAAATPTRKSLERAIQQSPRAVTPRFYLGRVERMLGRDQDALRHFREVLEAMPHHVEAGSEVRAIESRMGGDKGGGGLFGRIKR
jgi:hypothetical protein